MKHQIPQMLKRGGGAIVNMSSIAGNIAIAGIPLYVASKHAVIGLTKSVALEYAKQNIRVNAVSPGAIETELFKRFAESNPEFVNRILAAYPMGRPGRPEEVAGAVLWLCSEDASFVTGQTVTMDGGFTVQ
jgi:NAD(P)-dependent dehydrogenase (short-subunit alcohol dehydrogenase family)